MALVVLLLKGRPFSSPWLPPLDDVMGVPAWKPLPSWYMVVANDQALPPDAQRMFAGRMGATVAEVPSGHLAMISHSGDVAKLINTVAESVSL